MGRAAGGAAGAGLQVDFGSSLKLEFHGSKVASNAGQLPSHELAGYEDIKD